METSTTTIIIIVAAVVGGVVFLGLIVLFFVRYRSRVPAVAVNSGMSLPPTSFTTTSAEGGKPNNISVEIEGKVG